MIKINLLPARKPKRVAPEGEKTVAIGVGGLIAAGVVVWATTYRPISGEVAELTAVTTSLQRDVKSAENKLKGGKDSPGYDELKKAVDAATARSEAIRKLAAARAVPAHMLDELSTILTPGRMPTMTREMAARVEKDPNRGLAPDWDPKHVWLTSFVEKDGRFTLQGGAQSGGDANQLAKRMQASVYFDAVVPEGGQEVVEKDTGATYYRFTISGKVVY
jgi:type IV pilus assembly protein PilN